jgi:hypothetical protein
MVGKDKSIISRRCQSVAEGAIKTSEIPTSQGIRTVAQYLKLKNLEGDTLYHKLTKKAAQYYRFTHQRIVSNKQCIKVVLFCI